MVNIVLLKGLLLPLIGFITLFFSAGTIDRTKTYLIGCTTLFLSFCCFFTLLCTYTFHDLNPVTLNLYSLMSMEKLSVDMALYLDPLSLLMTLIITGVGFLIHLYATGYMDHESDFARFYACLNFFVFSMLLLVLGKNLVVLFIGWEGVGLASYLLIGFWYTRPQASAAAVKAFVVNRIGDLGLLLAILLSFTLFTTTDINTICREAVANYPVGTATITVLTLLLFIGAMGKSAQFPLHVWLPDAMEGPTPVSALIHAATMVTAGVYLVVRLHCLFELAPMTMNVIACIGAFTALFAAFCAVGQTDLKRVLAYSTVSQLGLMFLACGIGGFFAAMLHLTMHAFMKALLFLSAGNVVHMMHGTTEMKTMGGLKEKFTITHILFLIGVLAMSGIPPLAAFFSKDLILEESYLTGHKILYFVGSFASILTAFYLMRAYLFTFTGRPRSTSEEFAKIEEAPPVMIIPVVLLGVLSIFGGFLGFSLGAPPALEEFLGEVDIDDATKLLKHGFEFNIGTWIATLGGLAGIGLAMAIYRVYRPNTCAPLKEAFYIDKISDLFIVRPVKLLSTTINHFIEPKIFTGMIDGVVELTNSTGLQLQKIQSGQIRSYIAWMGIGAMFLIIYFVR